MSAARPITIAITAMGGQGGGVLAGWIADMAKAHGFAAQSTSVPGVAQRTGATIYYVELFPEAAAKKAKKAPVLALMPFAGDVDIVIASEMMEAGRALLRGLVSTRTTLIASTHRVYAISEKEILGDGRKNTSAVRKEAEAAAGRFIAFDMEAGATESRCIISAVLFGALAGSGALPFARADFEQTIREGGKAVAANMRGFALGFERASAGAPPKAAPEKPALPRPAQAVAPLLARLDDFAPKVRPMLLHGLKRVVDYQDAAYGALYLERMDEMHALDVACNGGRRGWRLSMDTARYLALAMSYEDTIRVAEQKTRASRFARFRREIGAGPGQIVRIREYMHPRLQEFCDVLPQRWGRSILKGTWMRRALGIFFTKGRRIETTSVHGFVFLRLIAALKPKRRGSLRFAQETRRIEDWLAAVREAVPANYALGCEIAGLQRLIKGYGDTHERGLRNAATIMTALEDFRGAPDAHKRLRTLKEAALADEDGLALQEAMQKLSGKRAA